MKRQFLNPKSWLTYAMPIFALFLIVGCGDDDPVVTPQDPIASFQFEIDANDFLTVNFSNFSQNATSYMWDFGDGNNSADESPSHTYEEGGTYTVVLTASNAEGTSANRSETITVTDPNEALKLLTGETSKTWKLFREGVSMSLGPNADSPAEWWSGLQNDGSRPCMYEQEFTFGLDGSYTFDDKGMFWAEFGVFNNVANCDVNVTDEQCLDATAANMVNACGDDVSAWLSGSHTFDYDASAGTLTINGMGAWIGIPKLASNGETLVPVNSVTSQASIEQFDGYDVLTIVFDYGGAYWPIKYASYSDASLEPELETEEQEFGEDLPDFSPMSLGHSFMEAGASSLDTIISGSQVTFGVDDPTDPTAICGEFYNTTNAFEELQFQTSPDRRDINFENLSTASIDVYLPSTNDYSGPLNQQVIIGFGDVSQTEQWWTTLTQYISEDQPLDQWVTVTFDLSAAPTTGGSVYDRTDFDMIFVNIGGSAPDHTQDGVFYVRNLRLE